MIPPLLTLAALLPLGLLLGPGCTSECPEGDNSGSLYCHGSSAGNTDSGPAASSCNNPNETACLVGPDNTKVCVDTDVSVNHCGMCGNECDATLGCLNGECVTGCINDDVLCNGNCIKPLTDAQFCGASGTCTGAESGAQCNGNLCVAGSCATMRRYLGSLPPSVGRWNYGGVVGVPGATALCRSAFALTTAEVCTDAHLIQAAALGELVNPVDTNGAAVAAWWIDNAATPTQRCIKTDGENQPYTYPTADLGQGSHLISVTDAASGSISPLTNIVAPVGGAPISCAASRNVACCDPL